MLLGAEPLDNALRSETNQHQTAAGTIVSLPVTAFNFKKAACTSSGDLLVGRPPIALCIQLKPRLQASTPLHAKLVVGRRAPFVHQILAAISV